MHPSGVSLQTDHDTGGGLHEVDVVDFETPHPGHLIRLPGHQVFLDDAVSHHLDVDRVVAVDPGGDQRQVKLPAIESDPGVLRVFKQVEETVDVVSDMLPERPLFTGLCATDAGEKDRVFLTDDLRVEDHVFLFQRVGHSLTGAFFKVLIM